ncbi:MAG: hypothetical protein ABIY48_10165, partial [Acidimicrobiales bacterium]
MHAVATSARRAGRGMAKSVSELTSGQRWTVSLMLGLAVVVLAFGLPTATRLLLPAERSAAAETPSAMPPAPGSANTAPNLATHPILRPASSGVGSEDAPPRAADGSDVLVLPSASLKVVALVDPAAGTGDRTDEALARRFLAAAGVPATFVPITDTTATCAVARQGNLVLASAGLGMDLRSCLQAAGVWTLSFDDAVPSGRAMGELSSRRGAARSLLDTAVRAHTQLTGKLALVADRGLRSVLESLVPEARAKGLDISTVTWLAPGEAPVGVALDL